MVTAGLLISGLLVAGCSSSAGPPRSTPTQPALTSTVDASATAVQQYLDRVNALCDAVLPKVGFDRALARGGATMVRWNGVGLRARMSAPPGAAPPG